MSEDANKPTGNGSNGRDPTTGRFLKGNPGGPGNPNTQHLMRLRAAMIGAVKENNILEAAAALCEKARGGDVQAIKLLFEYTIGKPEQYHTVRTIGALLTHSTASEELRKAVISRCDESGRITPEMMLGALRDIPPAPTNGKRE